MIKETLYPKRDLPLRFPISFEGFIKSYVKVHSFASVIFPKSRSLFQLELTDLGLPEIQPKSDTKRAGAPAKKAPKIVPLVLVQWLWMGSCR
jgi:hypothetical protein